MKERPILFSGPMVRAILVGNKTQTRRVIKPQPNSVRASALVSSGLEDGHGNELRCPYGKPGDHLWVRETWAALHPGTDDVMSEVDPQPPICSLAYMADNRNINGNWRTSIFMPRWASRITLEITGIRIQRLSEISHADGKAEGFDSLDAFALLWDRINEKRGYGWHANPWVWAVEFRVVKA